MKNRQSEKSPVENDQAALAEAYRKKRLEMQQAQQAESQVKQVLKSVLEPDAYERLMNIKLSNANLYSQLVQMIVYLVKGGQVKGRVSEALLKDLTSKVIAKTRRETTIRRI
ncbi:MAG: DNA-binding protein [Candidatus Micrarchaeia archaeon]